MSDDDNICPSHGVNHDEDPDLMAIPANIFTGGLSADQMEGLEVITQCMDRAHLRMQDMITGRDEVLKKQYDTLYRVLYGISDSAVIPIMALIQKGANPAQATKSVISAIGGMMFMAGWEFGKYEDAPEDMRRPVQPAREMSTRLSDKENLEAKQLLEELTKAVRGDSTDTSEEDD